MRLVDRQARNNARVVVTGSLDLFSNEFVLNKDNGNKEVLRFLWACAVACSMCFVTQFVEALAGWVFKATGVIEISNLTHHRIGETSTPREYTVSEDVVRFSSSGTVACVAHPALSLGRAAAFLR